MLCSVNDAECIGGRLRRGMCERHYRRWKSTGSTDLKPPIDNFARYTVLENGCWRWDGSLWPNGYGKTSVEIHGTNLAHRVFYIERHGPLDSGVDLDHQCHNADPDCVRGPHCLHRRCVNPEHLDPVSRQTNLNRAMRSRTVCESRGHDLTLPESVRPGTMQCIACWRERYRASGQRYRDRLRAERD